MWKYVSCRLRETLQRSVNYFDARCGADLASNQQTCIVPRKDNPVREYRGQETHKCSGSFDGKDTNKNFNWHQCHILHSWINAFSWSGAIVLGWYSSQLFCINHKRNYPLNNPDLKKKCLRKLLISKTWALHSTVLPRIVFAHPNESEDLIPQNIVNTVHLNDAEHYNSQNRPPTESSSFENSLDEAVRGLTNTLSSVENRLGLAAIEGGDVKYGVEMLQSAAQKNHAPALYNLALCYQKGVGVTRNEKMAAELYHAAAALDHPAAMYNLAIFYGQGRGGLTQDLKAAEDLLRMAASKGQQDAIKALPKSCVSLEEGNYKLEMNLNGTPVTGSASVPISSDSIDVDKDPYTPMRSFLNIITGNDVIPTYTETQRILLY